MLKKYRKSATALTSKQLMAINGGINSTDDDSLIVFYCDYNNPGCPYTCLNPDIKDRGYYCDYANTMCRLTYCSA